ncbi:MAG: hypothetical protein QXU92_02100 [Candidatus Diapherotrites archaeon]
MSFGYLKGFVLCFFYRLLRVFPNSDPLVGFLVPASKNEPLWKPVLFAFFSMLLFDFFTFGVGVWSFVTSFAYVLVVLFWRWRLSFVESSLGSFLSNGVLGILLFDFITGPLMSSFIFKQDFFLTLVLQVPFTIMHLVSGCFSIILISPFLDKRVALEASSFLCKVKTLFSFRSFLK